MKISSIQYPTTLDKIVNTKDDNIDIFVELENGNTYTLTVCTPMHYYTYMKKEKIDFIPASPPDIIVMELREDIIRKAVENFCEEDAFWLRHYAAI